MTAFHQVNVDRNNEIPSALIEKLTNGKALSLYVDGIVSRIKPNSKLKESFDAPCGDRKLKYWFSVDCRFES